MKKRDRMSEVGLQLLSNVLFLALLAGSTLKGFARVSGLPPNGVRQSQSPVRTKDQPGAAAKSGEGNSKPSGNQTKDERPPAQRIVREGVMVEYTILPANAGAAKESKPLEGEDQRIEFKVTDARTGTPLTGLHPSVWMDAREGEKTTDEKECRQKIQSFLQGSLNSRPSVDLNTYYVLALNSEASISVIDPLLGYGGSKLLTLVLMKSPGEDWVLTSDKKKLLVTMPLADQVAVVDTGTWKVTANIDAGRRPSRIVLQQDEKYAWVGNDADASGSGVTVIDPTAGKAVARIETGAGHHEIALDAGDRHAYVTNKDDGTLSVINVPKLAKIKDVRIGKHPVSLAYSPLGKAVYAASESDGTVSVVGGPNQAVLARLTTRPGLRSIRFVPGGRWGFALNAKENDVRILDASTNRILHTIAVGETPDRISFTSSFAYVWSLGTEQVAMIQLDSIGRSGKPPVLDFPGGQNPPAKSSGPALADTIIAAPEGGSVLVANPADRTIYYYAEGMAAPMGSFQNYSREPRAVLVWDGSLRQVQPGTYSANVRLNEAGSYDVAFLLDSPRLVHCFDTKVNPNPALKAKNADLTLRVEISIDNTNIVAGEKVKLQFKAIDPKTNQPRTAVKDLGVLVFLAPGIWQDRQWAKPAGEGVYETTFTPPEPGVYYVFVHCPSLGAKHNQMPHLILEAKESHTRPPANNH